MVVAPDYAYNLISSETNVQRGKMSRRPHRRHFDRPLRPSLNPARWLGPRAEPARVDDSRSHEYGPTDRTGSKRLNVGTRNTRT